MVFAGEDMRETKNIPKNFVKASITYILKNTNFVKKIIKDQNTAEKFLIELAKTKMTISNIK